MSTMRLVCGIITLLWVVPACTAGESKDVGQSKDVAESKDVVLVRETATGRHAEVLTSALAPKGRSVSVRVIAVPNQRVSGSWTIACSYFGSSSRNAGDVR